MTAARTGRRTVLCEVAGQRRAAGLHGSADAPAGEETALRERLWTTTIDPLRALEEWAASQIDSRRVVHAVARERLRTLGVEDVEALAGVLGARLG